MAAPAAPTLPARSLLAPHWSLDPDVVYLNHGSFGAAPVEVLDRQAELRARLERQPVRFLGRELEGLLDEARVPLASFVGADPADLGFVQNATTGVNAVLRSLELRPGDELVTTSHAYGACRNTLDYVAGRAGATLVAAELPFPVAAEDDLVEPVLAALTERTRLLVIDHVTSPTGLVLPVERIAGAAAERGIAVLVDGAHGPGMVDVDLGALARAGVGYYAANCHKWICSPKGSGFLWVRPDLQPEVHPTVISHGLTSPRADRGRFRLEFDWVGTLDPTAWLCVPAALELLGSLLPGGWPELRARNRALALEARAIVCEALGVPSPCPDGLVGSLATVPLEPAAEPADTLAAELRERFGIEIPVFPFPAAPGRAVRLSAQAYNALPEYAYLADALVGLTPPPAART
jgi:isopenicillin-N epimerase